MRRAVMALLLAMPLGGCFMSNPGASPPPQVTISGPIFSVDQFDCGQRPAPPDPAKIGRRGGKAAGLYEDSLGTWGQRCKNKLDAVGVTLDAAGQIAKGGNNP